MVYGQTPILQNKEIFDNSEVHSSYVTYEWLWGERHFSPRHEIQSSILECSEVLRCDQVEEKAK